MFTGIVSERGRIASAGNGRLVVETALEAAVGDSVSVDGVCLTVVSNEDGRLVFDLHPETLRRVKPFRREANLESALRAGDPFGGHYVQGHVDGVGRVRAIDPEGGGRRLWIDAPVEIVRYCAEKGSVAVEGVSLTIAELGEGGFAVALVPHTLTVTTLGSLQPGDEINLEVDILAKYVERLVNR